MGAGDNGLGALLGFAHIDHIYLYVVALLHILPADLLVFRQHGLGLAQPQGDGPGAGVNALHQAADQLLVLRLELLHHLAPLAVPNALADDVAGGLGGHPAELLGVQLNAHKPAHAGGGVHLLGLVQQVLAVGVLHLFHNLFAQVHVEDALFPVHVDVHVLVAIVVLAGGGDGLLDLIQHILRRDALLLLQQIQSQKQLLVALLLRFLLLCHGLASLLCYLIRQALHPPSGWRSTLSSPRSRWSPHPAGSPAGRPPLPAAECRTAHAGRFPGGG